MNAERDAALRDGLDAIQGDMAAHQRITGKEVTAEANRQLAARTFEEVDDQICYQPAGATSELIPVESSVTTRNLEGREYTVLREPEAAVKARPVVMAQAERVQVVAMLKRLHFLLGLPETGPLGTPSWRQRALSVMRFFGAQGANEKRFAHELAELVEASSRYFGDWRRDDRVVEFGEATRHAEMLAGA